MTVLPQSRRCKPHFRLNPITASPQSPSVTFREMITRKTYRRRMGALVLSVFVLVPLIYLPTQSLLPPSLSRLLSVARDPSRPSTYGSCNIPEILPPKTPVVPVFAASYPGSGSQMLHYLCEALTGVPAGNEWHDTGDTYDHITIKTHYPSKKKQVGKSHMMTRAILLVRSPLHALPSLLNYLHEIETGLPNHTSRAPAEAWLKWRDENFEEHIQIWSRHIIHWVTQFQKSGTRLDVSYEALTDSRRGPLEAGRIASFLGQEAGVKTPIMGDIPCVWDRVVNYRRVELEEEDGGSVDGGDLGKPISFHYGHSSHNSDNSRDSGNGDNTGRRLRVFQDPTHPLHSLRKGTTKYDFTVSQLKTVREVLGALRSQFMNEFTLVIILTRYIDDVNKLLKHANTNGLSSEHVKRRVKEEEGGTVHTNTSSLIVE